MNNNMVKNFMNHPAKKTLRKVLTAAPHFILIVLLMAAISLFPACSRNSRGNEKNKTDESARISVTAATVTSERVEKRVDITGTLSAWEDATVSLEAEGRIIKINTDLGDRVKKDQVLSTIEDVEYQWKKAQADAELNTANADFKRVSELYNKNLFSRQQFDEAKRRLEFAKASAEYATDKLEDTSLRAPFDGLVAKRMINLGEYVRTGTPAYQIVMTSPLKFRGEVPERYTEDVKPDNEVMAYVESRRGEPLHGKIVRIGASVNAVTRSFPIEAKIENPDNVIKPGTFSRLSILTATFQDALTVPESGVTFFAGNPKVFVLSDGKAIERAIEIEGKSKDRYIITKGLAAGEVIATSGVGLLSDGNLITIRQ